MRFQLTTAFLALLVLAIIDFAQSDRARNVTVSRWIPYKYPWSVATVNRNSIADGRFAYLTCRPNLQPSGGASTWARRERVCQVYLEDFRNRETPTHTSCQISLDSSLYSASFDIGAFDVVPSHEDHVVVSWYVEDKESTIVAGRARLWRMTQVRMSDCRQAQHIRDEKITRLRPRAYATTADDRFLVLAEMQSDEGGSSVVYEMQVNVDGKLAKAPEPWFQAEDEIGFERLDLAPIAPPHNGEVVLLLEQILDRKTSRRAARFSKLVRQQARVKLAEFNLTSAHEDDRVIYSTSHGLLTFCLATDLEANCYQYDSQGERQLVPDIVLQTEHEIQDMAVHNLPTGGFLLALGRCPADSSCDTDRNTYEIHEFDAAGRKLAKTVAPRPKTSRSPVEPASLFFENTERDYCVMTLCADPSPLDDVVFTFAVTCIDGGTR